jgi:hypothetical protein
MFYIWQVVVFASILGAAFSSRRGLLLISAGWALWTLWVAIPNYSLWVGAVQLVNVLVAFRIGLRLLKIRQGGSDQSTTEASVGGLVGDAAKAVTSAALGVVSAFSVAGFVITTSVLLLLIGVFALGRLEESLGYDAFGWVIFVWLPAGTVAFIALMVYVGITRSRREREFSNHPRQYRNARKPNRPKPPQR